MDQHVRINPPVDANDDEGARCVFEDFIVAYQSEFAHVDHYLEDVMTAVDPHYAEAYRPWYRSLRILIRGAYLVARNVPLPDKEQFLDALRIFSFKGAIHFLRDICLSCQMTLERDWAERFREHIDLLLFSFSIINRQEQPGRGR